MSVNPDQFHMMIKGLIPSDVRGVAVGVSGGADSVALGACLARWCGQNDVRLHVLSVDHSLRAEAADEVAHVGRLAEGWGAHFEALKWEHDGAQVRVQEAARAARYELMGAYCRAHNIAHLCLGHHMDDQAETVLFRLCKGSGLDGLGGMRAVHVLDSGLRLVRPFLAVDKTDLVRFCEEHDVRYIDDPSNDDAYYARVRLRAAREVLDGEGLTSKRLAVMARRLSRAREALDDMALRLYEEVLLNLNSERSVFKLKSLREAPAEIALRCVLKAIEHFRVDADYQPRFEKVEVLFDDLMAEAPFRKRTLGGVVFERDDTLGHIVLSDEGR
jgi:tRNA(Ile)-lysidine synthase